jgi:hypothetical protein
MTLGLGNPAGALALAAVGVLVVLYLYDRRRRVIPVATLFLWKQVPASPLERERFRPDLLFLLQLALLVALIVGFLRPYLSERRGPAASARLLLVLDVSASMQARENGGTRFEMARRGARERVGALRGGGAVMLVVAAERAHVALRWTSDHAHIEERLEALAPLDTPTNLAPALELALGEAEAQPGTRVVAFTDLPREASGIDPARLATLDYVQIGTTDDNLALAGLTVEERPFRSPESAVATVLVRSFASVPRSAALEASIDGVLWTRRELSLAARGSTHVLLTDPPRAGELIVTLVADDALAVDDRAVGWLDAPPALDLELVTDSAGLAAALEEVAAAIGAGAFRVTSPARYPEAPPTRGRVTVFDRVVPATLPPAGGVLLLAPPPGNAVCPGDAVVDAAAVIDWESEHPILAGFTDLQALEVTRATRLSLPPWGEPVVQAASRQAAFPLLVAGEREGRRLACLAAGLPTPLAVSDRLPLLLLTLGTLRWLAQASDAGVVMLHTGRPVAAGPGPTAPVEGPDQGAGLRIGGDPPVLIAERTGVYRLGPGGERIVLANLFDTHESDIGRTGSGEWPASVAPRPTAGDPGRRDIGWWFYLAAAALLGLEWTIWRRRIRA